MKTQTNLQPTTATIWSSTTNTIPISIEKTLPVIETSQQLTCGLQTNDNNINDPNNIQNMDLIILPSNTKLTLPEPNRTVTLPYVVLNKENSFDNNNIRINTNTTKYQKLNTNNNNTTLMVTQNISNINNNEVFENMLYFVCNLCPFLCTKDTKITEHLANAHQNNAQSVNTANQLKCPACSNIFYHQVSLKTHLIHDHEVCSSDLELILQAVMYYSNKNSKVSESNINSSNIPIIISNSDPNSNTNILNNDNTNQSETEVILTSSRLSLPQVDIAQNNNAFTNLLNKTDPVPTYSNTKCSSVTTLTNNSDPVSKYLSTKCCTVTSCKVRLSDPSKLEYHIKSHDEEAFKCLECNEKFMFWKSLTSHLWRLHHVDMELFSCDKCAYKTNSSAKLNNMHKLIHSDIKAFGCDVCNKTFKNIKQLRNHKIIHLEKKKPKSTFECEICMKLFENKRTLKTHRDIVHNKIKPFLCSYCGYKGASRSALQMHIRMHTGEKPFSCDQCAYTTSDHNSIRRHKLRHTGHKPYKCSFCTYACIQSSTYKVHLKTKHPDLEKDLMFTCSYCQFRSVNKELYTSHLITVHDQTPTKISVKS